MLLVGWITTAGQLASVSAKHERLERKHQRLQPQNQGMYECERINNMKHRAFEGAGVFCNDRVMVVGIGIGDAAASGCHAVKAALEEGLEKDQERARS